MTAPELEARLRTRWLARPVEVVAETGSTNDDVLARARAGAPHGLVIFAEAQARGRGRLGRSWFSPPGENLAFSALLRLPDAPPVTLAAGVAVQEALNDLGWRASIKWPNDVLLDGKKVAGILADTSTRGQRREAIALGVGVNVNARAFPPELAGRATSLWLERGGPELDGEIDRVALAALLLEKLERWLMEDAASVARAFRERSGMLGRRVQVTVEGAARAGVATGMDDGGALEVQADDGRLLRVVSGEVEVS